MKSCFCLPGLSSFLVGLGPCLFSPEPQLNPRLNAPQKILNLKPETRNPEPFKLITELINSKCKTLSSSPGKKKSPSATQQPSAKSHCRSTMRYTVKRIPRQRCRYVSVCTHEFRIWGWGCAGYSRCNKSSPMPATSCLTLPSFAKATVVIVTRSKGAAARYQDCRRNSCTTSHTPDPRNYCTAWTPTSIHCRQECKGRALVGQGT